MAKLQCIVITCFLIAFQAYHIDSQGFPSPDSPNRPPDERLKRPRPLSPPPSMPIPGPPRVILVQQSQRPVNVPPPPRQENLPPRLVFPGPPRPGLPAGFNPDRIRIEGFAPVQKRSVDDSQAHMLVERPGSSEGHEQRRQVVKRDSNSWQHGFNHEPAKKGSVDFVNEPIGKKVKFNEILQTMDIGVEDRSSEDLPMNSFSEDGGFEDDVSMSMDASIRRDLSQKFKLNTGSPSISELYRLGSPVLEAVRVRNEDGIPLKPEAGFFFLNSTSNLTDTPQIMLINHAQLASHAFLSNNLESTSPIGLAELLNVQQRSTTSFPFLAPNEAEPADDPVIPDEQSLVFTYETPIKTTSSGLLSAEDNAEVMTELPAGHGNFGMGKVWGFMSKMVDKDDDDNPQAVSRTQEDELSLNSDSITKHSPASATMFQTNRAVTHSTTLSPHPKVTASIEESTTRKSTTKSWWLSLWGKDSSPQDEIETESEDEAVEAVTLVETQNEDLEDALLPSADDSEDENSETENEEEEAQTDEEEQEEEEEIQSNNDYEEEIQPNQDNENEVTTHSISTEDSEDEITVSISQITIMEVVVKSTPEHSSTMAPLIPEEEFFNTVPAEEFDPEVTRPENEELPEFSEIPQVRVLVFGKPITYTYHPDTSNNDEGRNFINATGSSILAQIVRFTQDNAGVVVGVVMGSTALILVIHVLFLRFRKRRSGKLDISPLPLEHTFINFEGRVKPRTNFASGISTQAAFDAGEDVSLREMTPLAQLDFDDCPHDQPKVLAVTKGTAGAF